MAAQVEIVTIDDEPQRCSAEGRERFRAAPGL
jgi:hypothetical protein